MQDEQAKYTKFKDGEGDGANQLQRTYKAIAPGRNVRYKAHCLQKKTGTNIIRNDPKGAVPVVMSPTEDEGNQGSEEQ